MAEWRDELRDRAGAAVSFDASIGELTTYRVGGRAAALVRAATLTDLRAVGAIVAAQSVPVAVVGRGSNLLVSDAGFDGIVVVLGEEFSWVGDARAATDDEVVVRVGAATPLPVVARRTVALGLTGFEWAVGVPGTIGGAVRMNAGGHGSDMAASLIGVHVVDLATGEDWDMPSAELHLGFRRSALDATHLVVEAELALRFGDRDASEAELAEIVRWRREHQPGGANAGSVFRNPPDDSCGRLLDASGAKGRRHGSAEVSTKHANFILVDEGGRADDVAALMVELRALVFEAQGVDLHAETHMLGFTPATAEACGAHLVAPGTGAVR
mgnify:CR=1 FL=1